MQPERNMLLLKTSIQRASQCCIFLQGSLSSSRSPNPGSVMIVLQITQNITYAKDTLLSNKLEELRTNFFKHIAILASVHMNRLLSVHEQMPVYCGPRMR